MAVPAKRVSKTRKRLRRTHYKIFAKSTVECPNCKAVIKQHRACPKCGFYNGKKVIEIKEAK